jgi:tetratricopeptide (TPR) repeat protein
LKSTWDLELARSLRIAANETPNTDLQQKYVVDAQTALDKFLTEQANHEEAASAQMTSGDISLFRAQNALRVGLRDKTKKDTLIPEARKLLGEARPKFEKAVTMYKERADKARGGAKGKVLSTKAQKQYTALVEAWQNARFKLATVDYNIGLTYTEPAAPPRKAALALAAKGFDSIYQENRDERVGIYAKMWGGKAAEELGELEKALDIYDEVMSAAPPDKDKRQADYAAMFQEVNRFRLMLLGKTKRYADLVEDATEWLRVHESVSRSNGYQGIALELAKAHLELAKTAKGAEAAKSAAEAKKLIIAIIKIPSEYQKEAILLQRQSTGDQGVPLASFDEAIAVADSSAKAAAEATAAAEVKANWTEAEKAYARAIELSAEVKDKNRVLHTRFALATAQYMIGKAPEGYTTALTLAKENTSYAKAPAAASLAVNIALYLYGQTPVAERGPAMERINESTELLLKQWPQHAEADDARIAKGKLKLLQNPPDFNGAIETFTSVNTASDRYPTGLQLAGQTHWVVYNNEKKKGDTAMPDVVQTHRKKTVELLEQSMAAFAKTESGGAALAQSLLETQLLLAEVRLEGNQMEEALQLLQPMVETLKAKPPTSVDRTTLRILVNSVRAYATLGKVNDSIEVGNILVNGGEDIPPVNGVLIEFAKMIKGEWKKAAAELIAALAAAKPNPANDGEEDGRVKNAKLAETNTRNALTKLLNQLNARKQHDHSGLVFLAESSLEISQLKGLEESVRVEFQSKARDQFQAIVDRTNTDPVFAKLAAKAMTRVRSQLIGLLREEKKYPEALAQVEALLKEQPNALEPMIEKGNIIQALAEADPKKYDEAAKWWSGIRNKLQNQPGKKPPAYYEVVYNTALCLSAQKQPEKSSQASQLLSATLALAPSLDGPDRVEKYKALLKQLPTAKAATAKPAAAKPKK